jgi:serine protease AprX
VDVIVQFKTAPTKDELKQLGAYGQIKKQFVKINGVSVSLTSAQIEALSNNPNISYISPNRPTKGTQDITTVVSANIAWTLGYQGTGVGVAVIDSGIYAHNDLKTANGLASRIVYSQSFIPGLNASDQNGHGTHVAGIVGGNGKDSTGLGFTRTFKGIAPNVNLVNLRVLDSTGAGTDAGVIDAIETAISLKATYNIRIINLSLGRPVYESYTLDPLCQAVEAAWRAGIVVITAAGNYGRDNSAHTKGYGTIVSPGNDPYVITVGAMNTMGTAARFDDQISSYSSKGPTAIDHVVKPDLVAPGNGVISLLAPNSTLASFAGGAVPNSYYKLAGTGNSSNYLKLSGTSMATPVVSGAAALLLQQYPSLTPDQVKARLMKTAQKSVTLFPSARDRVTGAIFNMQSDVFTVGAGYLNIQAALYNTDLTSLPALSPTAVYNPTTHKVTIARNHLTSWGSSVIWGDALLYGAFVLNGLSDDGFSVVWGDSVIWGMADDGDGFSVVWGDCIFLVANLSALSDGDDDEFSVIWGD